MEDAQSLTFRLESYLVQLADINRRWTEWLAESETAVIRHDVERLREIESSAQQLFEELTQAARDRESLLEDAKQAGWNCPNLQTLAQRLPAWNKPMLRSSFAAAKQQLWNLRRLHIATWVLINQAVHYYSGSMQLMIAGKAQAHVYTANGKSDTNGGRLLDASL